MNKDNMRTQRETFEYKKKQLSKQKGNHLPKSQSCSAEREGEAGGMMKVYNVKFNEIINYIQIINILFCNYNFSYIPYKCKI